MKGISMRLQVYDPLKYISFSSFSTWKLCPFKFYQEKLSGRLRPPRQYSRAMMIGSYVDIFIKDFINKKLGIESPLTLIEELAELPIQSNEFVSEALSIAEAYIKNIFISSFFKPPEVYFQRKLFKIISGVPIYGILDATVQDQILEFKCRGFNKKLGLGTTNPYPGYHVRYDLQGLQEHPSRVPEDIHSYSESWAQQICFYGWLLGQHKNIEYRVHEIANSSKGPVICVHKGKIDQKFSENLFCEVEKMWHEVNKQFIEIPSPETSIQKCNQYRVTCEQAPRCEAYQKTLGNKWYKIQMETKPL